MLETLKIILSFDCAAPEIILEDDGCLDLDWGNFVAISIHEDGKVSWACLDPQRHGTNLDEIKAILESK